MKTEHLVQSPKPVLPHIHPIHRSGPDAACEKQMPGFVTKLDEVNHRRHSPTERSGDVSPEQIESGNKQRIRGTTGRTCMDVLARPAHQSEVCEGPGHSLGCDSDPSGGYFTLPYLCGSHLKGECYASYSQRSLALHSIFSFSPKLPVKWGG